jgi:hypothetical protein
LKIGDVAKFKEIFEIEWSDFMKMMGEYFLTQLGETNPEYLESLSTLIDESQTGDNMFCVYLSNDLRVRSERYFSLVNTFNILKFGNIVSYTPPLEEG